MHLRSTSLVFAVLVVFFFVSLFVGVVLGLCFLELIGWFIV